MKYSALSVLGFLALGCSVPDDEGSGLGPGVGTGKNGNGSGAGIDLPIGPVPGSEISTPGVSDLPPEFVEQLRASSCTGWSAEPEALPSVIQLVVDVSSSMSWSPPGSRLSKWEITREALLEGVVGVNGPGLPSLIAVGLLFYPNRPRVTINARPGNLTGCVRTNAMVDIAELGPAGAPHRRLLEQRIREVELNLSTPTHDAYRYALNTAVLPTRLPGNKYMLLITDGTPTLSLGCVNPTGELTDRDPRPIVEEVRIAAEQQVKTFLIGSPGSERNRQWMSQAARIGGTASPGCSDQGPNFCHMDLTTSPDFSEALRAGLKIIAGQIVSCNYPLPEPPPGQTIDPYRVNVVLTPSDSNNSQLIGRTADPECAEGWRLTGDELTICPSTCDAIRRDQGARLELLFGCQGVEVPPE